MPTQENVLDVAVSWFTNVGDVANPKSVSLLYWITHHKSEYDEQLVRLRATTDEIDQKVQKKRLVGFCPHGTFSYRSVAGFQQHSGLIALDVDHQDNTHLADFDQLKYLLSEIPEVAYVGLSARGKGYFVLVPIAYPDRHADQFAALVTDFNLMGLKVDPSGRNIDRFRYYCFDPDAHINPYATRYIGLPAPKPKPKPRVFDYNASTGETTRSKVEDLVRQLSQHNADVTGGEREWFEIGCALANEFGEAGRDYFHTVSQYYPGYRPQETDEKFDYALRHAYPYSIGTFFKCCADAGFSPRPFQREIVGRPTDKTDKTTSVSFVGRSTHTFSQKTKDSAYATSNTTSIQPHADNRRHDFFEWQRTNPPFNRLGLASMPQSDK